MSIALEKLNTLRSSTPPTNLEARHALEWLDEVTSATENKSAGFVQLQGPDDRYTTWQEVEKYLLPETPLSALGGHESLDGINEAFARDLELRPRSSGELEGTGENGLSRDGSGQSTPASGMQKRSKGHGGKSLGMPSNAYSVLLQLAKCLTPLQVPRRFRHAFVPCSTLLSGAHTTPTSPWTARRHTSSSLTTSPRRS